MSDSLTYFVRRSDSLMSGGTRAGASSLLFFPPFFHKPTRLFRTIFIPLLIPGDAGGSGVLGFEEVVEAGEVIEVVVEAAVGEE